jgi:hypothetical protein
MPWQATTLDRRISTVDPASVHVATRPYLVLVVAASVLAPVACGREESRPAKAAGPVAQEPALGPVLRWRFLPTLQASLPSGVTAVPIMEVGLPHRGKVRIMAAAFRPGQKTPLRVELLDFDQNNERDKLELEGEPTSILRLDGAGSRSKELLPLRRQMAAPRSKVYRPLGLDVAGPAELVARLTTAAKTTRDDTAGAQDRAQALADLVRGLDDSIVFERDELYLALETFGQGPWSIEQDAAESARRHAVVATARGRSLKLGIVRTSGGWTLASMEPVSETHGSGSGP